MSEQPCYIDSFAHLSKHRGEAVLRPCGHWACEPHTITYYGTEEEPGDDEGEYCMVCYNKQFPGMCPDRVLREALKQQA
jgi:hypothetical protein